MVTLQRKAFPLSTHLCRTQNHMAALMGLTIYCPEVIYTCLKCICKYIYMIKARLAQLSPDLA